MQAFPVRHVVHAHLKIIDRRNQTKGRALVKLSFRTVSNWRHLLTRHASPVISPGTWAFITTLGDPFLLRLEGKGSMIFVIL